MSRRRVHLVADYGQSDLAFAEIAQALELAVAGAEVRLTRVPASDSLAAGWWSHCLASLHYLRPCCGWERTFISGAYMPHTP